MNYVKPFSGVQKKVTRGLFVRLYCTRFINILQMDNQRSAEVLSQTASLLRHGAKNLIVRRKGEGFGAHLFIASS